MQKKGRDWVSMDGAVIYISQCLSALLKWKRKKKKLQCTSFENWIILYIIFTLNSKIFFEFKKLLCLLHNKSTINRDEQNLI